MPQFWYNIGINCSQIVAVRNGNYFLPLFLYVDFVLQKRTKESFFTKSKILEKGPYMHYGKLVMFPVRCLLKTLKTQFRRRIKKVLVKTPISLRNSCEGKLNLHQEYSNKCSARTFVIIFLTWIIYI